VSAIATVVHASTITTPAAAARHLMDFSRLLVVAANTVILAYFVIVQIIFTLR